MLTLSPQLVPSFKVLVNGSPLPADAAGDLLAASVLEDTMAPSMFTLTLLNWDMNRLEVTWADSDLMREGNEVEVQMGYVDDYETLLVGEITGLEPEFFVDEVPKLVVRGHDRGHRLMRGHHTRTFVQVKDSDIVSQLASEAGLNADTTDTGVLREYVLQHNQTDLNFIQQRARQIGYELLVDDRTLIFRPIQNSEQADVTLDRVNDLLFFCPRLSTLGQVSESQVRGWSVLEKTDIVSQTRAGQEGTTMGGTATGSTVIEDSLGTVAGITVTEPIANQAEADQLSQGRLKRKALSYISGDATCVGRTDLRAGMVVRIEGVGERFSGQYYVPTVTHTYTLALGYRTHFTLRRNAT